LGGHTADVTKDDFAGFIKKATQKGSPEYNELYYFLLSCFQTGDAHNVTLEPFISNGLTGGSML
jgi:hypothetical protein